ncbi:MAG: succinylglutamate desuccinylase/aspartoacylase family protein [Gemmatimonadaceae bacterium]|nr:succinylglutamate desuccinylase/aspartoacylase family protein [Gemmatimonadaceae bacterium]
MAALLGLALTSLGCPSDTSGSIGSKSDQPSASPVSDQGSPPLRVRTLGGERPGPRVTLVAGVHGGKVSAMRALDRLADSLAATELHGIVRIVVTANQAGYASGLAQLSPLDSLNLNRVFPGRADGRPTERLAARMMRDLVSQSDYLVDLHGADGEEAVGAFAYAARPGLDPRIDSAALHLATLWGTPRVVWDADGPRTLAESRFLQTAAHLSGVPSITVFEASAVREDSAAIAAFERGARNVLVGLGVLDAPRLAARLAPREPARHDRRAVVLADSVSTWSPAVRPGQHVSANELLGHLVGSSGVRRAVNAPSGGTVLHVRNRGDIRVQTPLTILAVDVSP